LVALRAFEGYGSVLQMEIKGYQIAAGGMVVFQFAQEHLDDSRIHYDYVIQSLGFGRDLAPELNRLLDPLLALVGCIRLAEGHWNKLATCVATAVCYIVNIHVLLTQNQRSSSQ
jgi:hypothetical protein